MMCVMPFQDLSDPTPFSLKMNIRLMEDNIKKESEDIEMANVTCRVRIFAPIDANGNLIQTYDSTGRGHYDLQILSSGEIDGRNFTNPILSYGHGGNPVVAIFEPGRETSVYTGKRVRLFHWTFTTTDTKVTAMISALGTYLNRNTERNYSNSSGKFVEYDAIKAPYNDYEYKTTNCFRAVAQWCNSLGRSELQTLYNANNTGNGYRNYLPWMLLPYYYEEKKYWTKVGDKQY